MNKNDQLFIQLVYIFHSSAMVAMGKLKNPEQAKQSIDLLEMIRDKTNGNLSSELQRTLDGFLTELRLNFVDEKNKDLVGS